MRWLECFVIRDGQMRRVTRRQIKVVFTEAQSVGSIVINGKARLVNEPAKSDRKLY
jgi:hypothetical protein